MGKSTFGGEVILSDISDRSRVRVTIEISLPPAKEDEKRIRESLNQTYDNIAKILANYLGATQYVLRDDPEAGIDSTEIFYKHLFNAFEELKIIDLHKTETADELEREFLVGYQ